MLSGVMLNKDVTHSKMRRLALIVCTSCCYSYSYNEHVIIGGLRSPGLFFLIVHWNTRKERVK